MAEQARWEERYQIALALHDQRRRLDGPQMLDAKLVWFADRVKRIAEADQASDASFIGDQVIPSEKREPLVSVLGAPVAPCS